MELGRKTFNEDGQAAFAKLSGDTNPMHMDVLAARRTQFGAPIVHGMHGVLAALESLCRSENLAIQSIRASFPGPIYVGDTAVFTLARRSDTQLRINVSVGEMLATSIVLGLGKTYKYLPAVNEAPAQAVDWPCSPVALKLEDIGEQSGAIAFARPPEHAMTAWPALSRSISPERGTAIVALSRLVGMICPGLYSIFKGFSLNLTEIAETGVLRYAVCEVDERFRLVRMAVSGAGIIGEVSSFGRVPPVEQPTMQAIAALVPQGTYAGAKVLVVGGSRGLGEVTAKACAAGGAHVLITYAVGRLEAERVAQEISVLGGVCGVIPFDVRGDIGAQLSDLPVSPTHLYYFASCPIVRPRGEFLSTDVLADFLRFYVTGFFVTCNALIESAQNRELRIFYPSSVAVTDAPKGWAEYAMAKAAGEVLCQNMNQYLGCVRVLFRRLPRMLTDQTATVLPVESAPVLNVMLSIVNEMQA